MLLQRVLVIVALAIAVFMIAPPTSPILSSSGPDLVRQEATLLAGAPDERPAEAQPAAKARREPPKVRGVIVSGFTAGGPRFPELLEMIERTELNTVVLDIKDEKGELSWIPASPRLKGVGAGRRKIRDPADLVGDVKARGVWVIGRIVTFQDPILAAARPDLAVQDARGGIWRNSKGLAWADPYSSEVWEYNLELAREAISLGFDEVQFDYIRFPSDGNTGRLWYLHRDLREETQVISGFLQRARAEIVPRGAWLSVDLFGLVTLATHDLGVGQKIELIAREVDYISLMLYPSHYNKPEYDIKDPEKEPYRTVSVSLADARRRIEGTGARLRPWLQDFSLRVKYTPFHVREQIRAAEDAGVDEWLLWNASNRYSEDSLRPATARPAATRSPATSRR